MGVVAICACKAMYAAAHMWESEESSVEFLSSFYLYGASGDQTQVISIAQQEPLPPGLPHQSPVESLNRAGTDL